MILMTTTKAELLSFDCENMRYPSSKFCNLLKIFTPIKASSSILSVMCFFCLFDFLIPVTTETAHSSRSS